LERIQLRVPRFFRDNPECRSKTFVEQIDGLTRRWSRIIDGLRRTLTAIGLALAGRAGVRLATRLGIGRDAEPVTAWLQEHESPAVICRDRATAYAEAARTAAPEAVQVADRFRLWQNWATAVEKCVARHKSRPARWPNAAGPINLWSTNC
jgi:hypothetical protein